MLPCDPQTATTALSGCNGLMSVLEKQFKQGRILNPIYLITTLRRFNRLKHSYDRIYY
jgi:hypothetical protein